MAKPPGPVQGATPPDPPDPPPLPQPPPAPVVRRAEYDSDADPSDDSAFDRDAFHRRRAAEADRGTRAVLLVVLLACLLPVAGCGFVFAVCTVLR